MKLPPAAVMVVVAATLISGCGSGDSSSSSEDSGTSAEQPARQYENGLTGREGEEANSDLYASGEYRRHLAKVHAARAIAAALTRAS